MPDPASHVTIIFELNGVTREIEVNPWETALSVLRDQFGLTGTKEGCGIGECGTCTIIVNGRAVNACLMLAAQLDDTKVETVESLLRDGQTHPIQKAFLEAGAVQCGFCTPGMILSAKALLDSTPKPSRQQIVRALSGNLCRCTGYHQIVEAVQRASEYYPAHRQDSDNP
jgi:carbon-monoxide dehydrogenase small subunit